jgi:L-lysine 2,3-aminomutase
MTRHGPQTPHPDHCRRDLVSAGLIVPASAGAVETVAARYAMAITPAMAALMPAGAPDDAIARQFLPDIRELDIRPEERPDPIGDEAHMPVPGIVHRYPDRVLLKIVHVCPVYCRFCFRREMVGPKGRGSLDEAELAAAFAYIAADPGIFEVILTGGDPFVLSARRARQVTQKLAAIPHVKVIRWHTRVPVVAPSASRRIMPAPSARRARPSMSPSTPTMPASSRRMPSGRLASSPMPASRSSASRCCCGASTTMPGRWPT